MLFQSSKLKARKSLFTETWQQRRPSFELWAFENVTPSGIGCNTSARGARNNEIERHRDADADEATASVTIFCRIWCCNFRSSCFSLAWDLPTSAITCAGAPSSLACLSLCFRVWVSVCFATMRLSSDQKCPLSCCLLCVGCSFGAFLPRNSVVPMIFCAVTCKADTMITLAFSAH